MKFLAFIGLIVLALSIVDAARSRSKRFAGFGAISTVGGRVGCVVSENGPSNYSLYINSHFTKYLNADEQKELEEYKSELAQYKDEIKAYIEERRKVALAAQQSGQRAAAFGGPRGALAQPPAQPQELAALPKQPESPKKPSFCSEKAVTQYVFDGCSVQGDSVFIGDNFVRKLTPEEQDRLVQFDEQFTAYQDSVRQQMEQIFGKQFGAFFDAASGGGAAGASSKSAEAAIGDRSVRQKSAKGADAAGVPQLDAPKTPDFCTLII